MGRIPTTHTWPHLIESSTDYKSLKKACAKHFNLDLENKAEASKDYFNLLLRSFVNPFMPFFPNHGVPFPLPHTTETYDNGLNNIVPTLISMTAAVQNSLLNVCKLELAGQLKYQQEQKLEMEQVPNPFLF
jgi:hypothetical protein